MHLYSKSLTAICVAIILTGCAHTNDSTNVIGPVQLPEQWQTRDSTTVQGRSESTKVAPWWRVFNDSQLTSLIDLALERNNNLAAAGFKLKRAQLAAGLAQNNQLPTLSGSASSSANRALSSNNSISRSSSVGVSIGYEVDLWGKLAQVSKQADWEAAATAQDLRSTEQSIAASVARLYWQIAYLNERIALGELSTAYVQKTLDLVQIQYKAGAVSQLEVISAQQSLANNKAAQAELISQREQARNALAILFDAPPNQHVEPELVRLPRTDLPVLSAGTPAQLLARRPDLAAAELRLRSTMTGIDVARANFYPSFNLTGSVNGSSSQLSQILSAPIGALALSVALPFLNWRENQLNLRVSKATYEQTVIEFRQTLYGAMAEVENALTIQSANQIKIRELESQSQLASKAEHLYEIRYRAGAASLKEWLDAQESARQASITLAAQRYAVYTNQLDLYLALGGVE